MNGSYIYSLLHAFQSHAEEEDASDFKIDRQVDKDLSQSCNLRLVLFSLVRHGLSILSQNRRRDS